MDSGNFVAVFLPLFTVFIVLLQLQKRRRRMAIMHHLRKKGVLRMSIDAIKRNIGRECQITTMLEKKVSGTIVEVSDNWVEIENKRVREFINVEFVERFRLL